MQISISDSKKIKLRRNTGRWITAIFRFILIFGLGFIILKPFISKLTLSFMGDLDFLDSTVKMIPRRPSLHMWKFTFENMHMPQSLINSVILSLSVALLQLITSTLVGYGLARFKFRGRSLAFAFVIAIMLVPYQVISIAQYTGFSSVVVGEWHVSDSFLPLMLLSFCGLGLKEGLYIYLIRENFKMLPDSIEEAAYIDGAGVFRTFWQVMLPNLRTIMVTVFLFGFCWQWTDNTYTTLYLRDTKVFSTILNADSVTFRYFRLNSNFVDWTRTQIAWGIASLIIMIPLLFLFGLCQRFFIKSISQAGLSNT